MNVSISQFSSISPNKHSLRLDRTTKGSVSQASPYQENFLPPDLYKARLLQEASSQELSRIARRIIAHKNNSDSPLNYDECLKQLEHCQRNLEYVLEIISSPEKLQSTKVNDSDRTKIRENIAVCERLRGLVLFFHGNKEEALKHYDHALDILAENKKQEDKSIKLRKSLSESRRSKQNIIFRAIYSLSSWIRNIAGFNRESTSDTSPIQAYILTERSHIAGLEPGSDIHSLQELVHQHSQYIKSVSEKMIEEIAEPVSRSMEEVGRILFEIFAISRFRAGHWKLQMLWAAAIIPYVMIERAVVEPLLRAAISSVISFALDKIPGTLMESGIWDWMMEFVSPKEASEAIYRYGVTYYKLSREYRAAQEHQKADRALEKSRYYLQEVMCINEKHPHTVDNNTLEWSKLYLEMIEHQEQQRYSEIDL